MKAAFELVCFVGFAGFTARTAYVIHKLLRDYRLPLPEAPAEEPAPMHRGGNAHQRRIARRAEKRRNKLAAV